MSARVKNSRKCGRRIAETVGAHIFPSDFGGTEIVGSRVIASRACAQKREKHAMRKTMSAADAVSARAAAAWLPCTSIVPDLAFEARKAPGGAYHHNIFHQAEHLFVMLRDSVLTRECPHTILWPYAITPWTKSLVAMLLPETRLISTCCGRDKVAARWWTGRRHVCPCWQRVCPERRDGARAAFWPGDEGRAAHHHIRQALLRQCRHPTNLAREAATTVRLVTRPKTAGRQLEDTAALLVMLRSIRGVERVEVVVADHAAGPVGSHNGSTNAAAFLCSQAAWYANAKVVITVHGSQNTNAIFADDETLVIDLLPYGYAPEAAAPTDYYAAVLENTGVRYVKMATSQPAAPPRLKGDPAATHQQHHYSSNATRHSASSWWTLVSKPIRDSPARCSMDKRCRLAYRDGGEINIGEASLRRIKELISRELGQ